MAKITRYTGDLQAFASESLGTERTVFGDVTQADDLDSNITSDFFRGWGIVGVNENPTKQDFNGLGYTLGQLLSYLHQMGMAEWDGAQEYQEDSFVNRGGAIYRCLTTDHTSATAPEADATNWKYLLSADDVTYDNTTSGATATDVQAAIDEVFVAVSPATESATGTAEIATQAETDAGTDDERIVTPLKLNKSPQTASAWVNFNGTGTVAIRDSFNVTSVTDNGTGNYTVNLTNPMANANYATGSDGVLDASSSGSQIDTVNCTDKTTGSFRVVTNRAAVISDFAQVNVLVFGDQ